MSTQCAPGYKGSNSDSANDVLFKGCWAEADAESLLFVEDIDEKDNIVIFNIFDLSKDPILDYRDSMTIDDFKEEFSYGSKMNKKIKGNKWTWHDKTKFPWKKIIKAGGQDGMRIAEANQVLSLAAQLAAHKHLRGNPVDKQDKLKYLDPEEKSNMKKLVAKLKNVLDGW